LKWVLSCHLCKQPLSHQSTVATSYCYKQYNGNPPASISHCHINPASQQVIVINNPPAIHLRQSHRHLTWLTMCLPSHQSYNPNMPTE
jgi:hypothetical protein